VRPAPANNEHEASEGTGLVFVVCFIICTLLGSRMEAFGVMLRQASRIFYTVVVQWPEFLTTNPEVLVSIPGATKFSE
jgi:hypothetical protein